MTSRRMEGYRLGIDVGGTFTDIVLIGDDGSVRSYKEPSTPHDPSLAVQVGIAGMLDRAGLAAEQISLVVHGTTIGLNTIIQRRGARTALVVSSGNRDILEIARLEIANPFDMYGSKETPLIPRNLVFEVSARTRVDGTVEGAFCRREIDDIAEQLREQGIGSVAVVLLNSYRHPEMEEKIAQALRDSCPQVMVSQSARLWPEMREYERAMITVLNAYIHPQMAGYFRLLAERLRSIALTAPVYITTNNGGTIGIETARNRPIDTILSGPASGVVASCAVAASCGLPDFMSVDIGGTSSDMSLTVGGKPEYSTRSFVGDFPLILPVVNVSAIGAGGGSVVWIDDHGILKVGPRSAGAFPGPICYGRGGSETTVTDCYLVLEIVPHDFLGGRMTLDRAAAVRALAELGGRLGFSGAQAAERAAEAALKVATAKMATEVHRGAAERGLDIRDFVLVALGGAGPTHATLLAEETGIRTVLVPTSPGTLCAMGAVLSDLKRDYVRSIRRPLVPEVAQFFAGQAATIEAEARTWLAQDHLPGIETIPNWKAEMRYADEGIGLTVELPRTAVEAIDLHAIAQAFHVEHERIYGFREMEATIEIMTLHGQFVGSFPGSGIPAPSASAAPPQSSTCRDIFEDGNWSRAEVFAREDLVPGAVVKGPAIVEQEDTTTWIRRGWHAEAQPSGIMRIERD